MAEIKRLSAEELAQIKERAEAEVGGNYEDDDKFELIAEVERLNGVVGTLVGLFEVARDHLKVADKIIEEALKYGEEELRG